MRAAILEENWDAIPNLFTVAKSISSWAQGKFKLKGESWYYGEEKVPSSFNERIIEMAAKNESPVPLFKFFERLQKNPSYRSVNQLWDFIKNTGIPITADGCFYTYKSVRADFKDVHSGHFDNHPGKTLEMPRNQISDDPTVACHEGFHVGAWGYVKSFHGGGNIVICKVDPENVVCVPHDESSQKMRVCKYTVVGHHNGEMMPNTLIEEDTVDNSEAKPEVTDAELDAAPAPTTDPKVFMLNEAHETHTTKGEVRKERAAASGSTVAQLKKMNTKDMLNESLDVLRKFASQDLKITGASKIPGGKVALVAAIMKHRK